MGEKMVRVQFSYSGDKRDGVDMDGIHLVDEAVLCLQSPSIHG